MCTKAHNWQTLYISADHKNCYDVQMGKPGPKPKGYVNTKWSSDFGYAIGLIATDG